jgi:hypothetical protein
MSSDPRVEINPSGLTRAEARLLWTLAIYMKRLGAVLDALLAHELGPNDEAPGEGDIDWKPLLDAMAQFSAEGRPPGPRP